MKEYPNKSHLYLPRPHSQPIYDLEVKNWQIPIRDGIRLFAKAWYPEGEEPFPAIINYDPYRSSDFRTIWRGNFFHYLAKHGYVFIHLGVRGTDGSEGTVTDEYPLQEQEDGYDAVEWVAAQSWCNGNVGMMGTSYAAFTAIQVAMHRPPHLKTIMPLYGTDDRYTDDVHYVGGALSAIDDLAGWATMMVSMNALPPQEYIGENFEKIWEEHLAGNSPYQLNWLEHQHDGPYWRPASLRPNYDLIECPVFIIGAWLDYYRNCAMRMFENLTVPKKLLMGPWGHVFPDWGYPGPAINFMPQAVRWFDHWLKGVDTGILEEPSFIAYMRESSGREITPQISSGYWRNITKWPMKDSHRETFYFSSQRKLKKENIGNGCDSYTYYPTVGMGYPSWNKKIAFGGDIARSFDEDKSLIYISDPLIDRMEIIGKPQLQLIFSSSAPIVNLIVKLFDLTPEGSSDLITWGVLNVSHHDSHIEPKPLTPGKQVKLNIELDTTSWIFQPNHIIKLALAGSDFPNIWPSPYPAENKVWWGEEYETCLILPIVPKSSSDEAPIFGEIKMPMNRYTSKQIPAKSHVIYNSLEDKTSLEFSKGEEGQIPEDGVEVAYNEDSIFTVSNSEPAYAILKSIHDMQIITKDSRSQALTYAKLESDEDSFHINYDLIVMVNEKEKYKKNWSHSYKRKLV